MDKWAIRLSQIPSLKLILELNKKGFLIEKLINPEPSTLYLSTWAFFRGEGVSAPDCTSPSLLDQSTLESDAGPPLERYEEPPRPAPLLGSDPIRHEHIGLHPHPHSNPLRKEGKSLAPGFFFFFFKA